MQVFPPGKREFHVQLHYFFAVKAAPYLQHNPMCNESLNAFFHFSVSCTQSLYSSGPYPKGYRGFPSEIHVRSSVAYVVIHYGGQVGNVFDPGLGGPSCGIDFSEQHISQSVAQLLGVVGNMYNGRDMFL